MPAARDPSRCAAGQAVFHGRLAGLAPAMGVMVLALWIGHAGLVFARGPDAPHRRWASPAQGRRQPGCGTRPDRAAGSGAWFAGVFRVIGRPAASR